jgi:FMN reductase
MNFSPARVVFLSGSRSAGSRSDRIAQWGARWCAAHGADVTVFLGRDLEFPFYQPGAADGLHGDVRRFLEALAAADGVVLVSPAYHGALSGLLKNALDYVNDLAANPRPFLDGRAIGCVAVSAGEQGAASTLMTMRVVSHALRGWPTPLGVAMAREGAALSADGAPVDPALREQLQIMLGQVLRLSSASVSQIASAAI